MSAAPPSSADRPVIRSADDIAALINRGPTGTGHANIIVLLALGGVFLDAYDLTTLSYGIGDVQKHFGLTGSQTGMVAAAMSAGTIIGSLMGGWLTDRIGRYAVFMADMACFVIAALVAASAPTASILILARFAMGFGVGMDLPVAMAFLSEFSKMSGKGSKAGRAAAWCPTWYAASSACFILVFALNAVIPASHPDWLWRASLGFGAVPALVIILVRSRYMSESPLWIARHGDLEKAAAILRATHGLDPVLHISVAPTRPAPPSAFALLRKPLLKRTVLVIGMKIVSATSYAAIAFGLPGLLSTMLHLGRTEVLGVSIVLNLVFAFTGGLLGVRLTRSFGSRPITLAGYAMQVAGILLLALTGMPHNMAGIVLVITGFALFLFAQGFGPGCQQMVYPTLSFPTELRGTGIGFTNFVAGFSGTLSMWALPTLYTALGMQIFWVILIAPLFGIALHMALRWEVFGYDADADPALRRALQPSLSQTHSPSLCPSNPSP